MAPAVLHPTFEIGVEVWAGCALLDVDVDLDTAGELLHQDECVLLDVEMSLDAAGDLQGVLQPMPLGLDTVVEHLAECAMLDVEMQRWLGSLSLSSAEDYVLIFTFGLKHHLGSHSLGLFHD